MATFEFKARPSWQESKTERREREERERAQRKERQERARQEERTRQDRWWQQWERARSGHVSSSLRLSEADKDMAKQIIDAGYRIMSLRNHPDKGGSHEAMVAVNRALEVLRNLVK